jgi:hypothetical protein
MRASRLATTVNSSTRTGPTRRSIFRRNSARISRRWASQTFDDQAAGTYAKQILNRLLIDLSWNSSRLEGNTYSLLDTTRLIELGEAAVGRDRLEAQMIVNHKDAIEFLVNDAEAIGFNRYTILNLHGILAQNLLPDPGAPGRLRRMGVGIGKSTFHPLELPQLIEECFNEVLEKATTIKDPFEQALFAMVQLPYLQPFDDVNKRVSRLSANIPFIKRNLSPLSFIDVPRALYMDAILGVYELNKIDLLRDVFIWAYERSAARYAAVRQSLGEPDPFRFKHKAALRQIVGEVVRGRMDRKAAAAYITAWVEKNGIPEADREKFRDMAEANLSACTKETSRATRSGPANSRGGNRSGVSARSHQRQTAERPHPLLFDPESARKSDWRRASPG